MTIISAYRVCRTTPSDAARCCAFTQQCQLLRQQGVDEPDPRSQFVTDLRDWIAELQDQGNAIVLMVDANEHIEDKDKNSFFDLKESLDLTYVISHQHGAHNTASYIDCRHTIEFVLASPELLQYISNSGIEPFYAMMPSDHRRIFIDLKLQQFFNSDVFSCESIYARTINMKNLQMTRKYRQRLQRHVHNQHIIERLDKLQEQNDWSTDHIRELQQIDKSMTEGMLSAERSLKRPKVSWYPEFAAANLTVRYWLMNVSRIRSGVDNKKQMRRLREQFKNNLTWPPTDDMTRKKSLLRQAQKARKQVAARAKEVRKQFLEERATEHAIANNADKEKIVVNMIKAQARAASHKTIQRILKPKDHKGLA